MKSYSTLLITREKPIKTTIRYHLILVRTTTSKTYKQYMLGEGVEKRKHSGTVGGNVN